MHHVLGTCNPSFEKEAIVSAAHTGTMLPCNILVGATERDETEVAAVDLLISMQATAVESLQ